MSTSEASARGKRNRSRGHETERHGHGGKPVDAVLVDEIGDPSEHDEDADDRKPEVLAKHQLAVFPNKPLAAAVERSISGHHKAAH